MTRTKNTSAPKKQPKRFEARDSKQASKARDNKKIAQLASEGVRIRKYFKPGTVALREIRRYQRGVELLIPTAPF